MALLFWSDPFFYAFAFHVINPRMGCFVARERRALRLVRALRCILGLSPLPKGSEWRESAILSRTISLIKKPSVCWKESRGEGKCRGEISIVRPRLRLSHFESPSSPSPPPRGYSRTVRLLRKSVGLATTQTTQPTTSTMLPGAKTGAGG